MRHPIRSQMKFRGADCLNCGAPLDMVDKYCHQCSQLNSTKRLALKDFFLEFFSGVFSYDNRTWRTIKTLLFRPGRVTREYVEGRRLSYANPFRFFLSVCIVYFLTLQLLSGLKKYGVYDAENSYDSENVFVEKDTDKGLIDISIKKKDSVSKDSSAAELNRELLTEIARLENGNVIERKVAESLKQELEDANNIAQGQISDNSKKGTSKDPKSSPNYHSQKELDRMNVLKRAAKHLETYINYIDKFDNPDYSTAMSALDHKRTRYSHALYTRAKAIHRVESNPALLVDAILPKLPIFLFLFTPVLALVYWLVYARRRFNYMEHLVFVFNIQGFIFISLIISAIDRGNFLGSPGPFTHIPWYRRPILPL